MRLLITNVLAMALLIFGAASASAFATTMSSTYTGTVLETGDQVEIIVVFNTEGANDIALLSTSVLFNDAVMTWDSSAGPTYALYVSGGKNNQYLVEASTNLSLRAGTSNQILLDWQNTALPGGNRDACGITDLDPVSACGFTMAVLIFSVANAGDDAAFTLSNSSPGNILQLQNGSNPTNTVSGDFVVTTPEPTTAVLVGLGLLGLGVAGRRRA